MMRFNVNFASAVAQFKKTHNIDEFDKAVSDAAVEVEGTLEHLEFDIARIIKSLRVSALTAMNQFKTDGYIDADEYNLMLEYISTSSSSMSEAVDETDKETEADKETDKAIDEAESDADNSESVDEAEEDNESDDEKETESDADNSESVDEAEEDNESDDEKETESDADNIESVDESDDEAEDKTENVCSANVIRNVSISNISVNISLQTLGFLMICLGLYQWFVVYTILWHIQQAVHC